MAVSEHVVLLGQFLHSKGIALGGAIISYSFIADYCVAAYM